MSRSVRGARSISVLGTFAAHRDQRRLRLRPSPQRLLALLAVRGDLPRAEAGGHLWPDVQDDRALANLRTVLWRARADAAGFVTEDGDVVRLKDVDVDVTALRTWAWRALRAEDQMAPPPQTDGRELLPGWSDEWCVQPREELHLLYLHALEAAGHRMLTNGRLGEAATLAAIALSIDPLRESANRLLIEIHIRNGNSYDALKRYTSYATQLMLETGTVPGPALTAMVEVSAAGRRPPGPAEHEPGSPLQRTAHLAGASPLAGAVRMSPTPHRPPLPEQRARHGPPRL